jgi:hypothetical protein
VNVLDLRVQITFESFLLKPLVDFINKKYKITLMLGTNLEQPPT